MGAFSTAMHHFKMRLQIHILRMDHSFPPRVWSYCSTARTRVFNSLFSHRLIALSMAHHMHIVDMLTDLHFVTLLFQISPRRAGSRRTPRTRQGLVLNDDHLFWRDDAGRVLVHSRCAPAYR